MAKGIGLWRVACAVVVIAPTALLLGLWAGGSDVRWMASTAGCAADPGRRDTPPVKKGAVPDPTVTGPVPESLICRGCPRSPVPETDGPDTVAVLNCVSDPRHADRWRTEARQCLAAANARKPVDETRPPEEIAAADLARVLRAELTTTIPDGTPDVHKEMLYRSLAAVNWDRVARLLLGK